MGHGYLARNRRPDRAHGSAFDMVEMSVASLDATHDAHLLAAERALVDEPMQTRGFKRQ
jgi:hypothetical protein